MEARDHANLSDVKPLAQALHDLTPGAHGALTVVPLLAGERPERLAHAGRGGEAVTIEEMSEGGDVPTLRLTSAPDRPVGLLDGEELIGAKQNRVLNTTVLVAAYSKRDHPHIVRQAGPLGIQERAVRRRRRVALRLGPCAQGREGDRLPARE